MTVLDAYISSENQTILWELVRKTSLFEKAQLPDPELWFQKHVENEYQQKCSFPSDLSFYQKVYFLNQKTLDSMIQNLNEINKMSLSSMIDNDTKMRFDGEKDSPIKNLEELVQERLLLQK